MYSNTKAPESSKTFGLALLGDTSGSLVRLASIIHELKLTQTVSFEQDRNRIDLLVRSYHIYEYFIAPGVGHSNYEVADVSIEQDFVDAGRVKEGMEVW